jgi:hypothetical protein
MQLVGVLSLGPGLFAHAVDGGLIQPAQVGGRFCIKKSPIHHGERPALFRRRIIKKSVGLRGENLLGQRRRFIHFTRNQRPFSAFNRAQQLFQTAQIHCFFQTIADCLLDQRMCGNFDWPSEPVVVCDGGPAFFGVEYDPEKKTFTHFEFNGPP